MTDRVSIHAAESRADLSDDSVQDGDPSSRSAASPLSSPDYEIVEKNILEHAPIPDDPHFQCKQIDEYVYPIMDKLNADLDRGAEKGIQGVQKRIFRIMGPLSQLWEMSDSIREHSKENPTVDNVDIAHMCQLVEKTVCCVGQASLAVDRHRRVNTLLKMTEDYKKAKELLDKNEDVISQSGNCLFGEGFKKVLKKSSKTWEEASKIAFSIKKGRKRKGGFKKKETREISPHELQLRP
ncbi:unnamed protein product [Mytilus coruscus]|uniref:Uncharacterized protein n=1 Tax=Mytilus coruscus TaxID=42192 RepID=A0A6J8DYE4_MYTCO|nr:unnamed protein product [Mytilus coruscus]